MCHRPNATRRHPPLSGAAPAPPVSGGECRSPRDEQRAYQWRNTAIFLSSNLVGEYVGLTETTGDLVTVAYGALALGDFDPHVNRFVPRVRWVG